MADLDQEAALRAELRKTEDQIIDDLQRAIKAIKSRTLPKHVLGAIADWALGIRVDAERFQGAEGGLSMTTQQKSHLAKRYDEFRAESLRQIRCVENWSAQILTGVDFLTLKARTDRLRDRFNATAEMIKSL